MKNILITLIVWAFCSFFVFAQDAVTSLTTTIFDQALALEVKDKKTYSNNVLVSIPADFWHQFERIDAVFISTWIGVGEEGIEQYKKDSIKMAQEKDMTPILYFAEKNPRAFSRPTHQTGFGLETLFLRADANEKCIGKYTKKKIAPRGIYPCMVKRQWTTTPIDFMYKYPLPKEFYAGEKCPSFRLFIRTSAKEDSVLAYTKVAVTIQGKRHAVAQEVSVDDFMETAMLSGLQSDGFPKDKAEWILNNNNKLFVTKCPLCMPSERAIKQYVAAYAAKECSTPTEILEGLSKDNKEDMQKAFSQLVARYVDRHFEKLQLNARDKAAMQKALEAARETGMGYKNDAFGTFCPSCDGACKVKE